MCRRSHDDTCMGGKRIFPRHDSALIWCTSGIGLGIHHARILYMKSVAMCALRQLLVCMYHVTTQKKP
jgi:hypothetical protein